MKRKKKFMSLFVCLFVCLQPSLKMKSSRNFNGGWHGALGFMKTPLYVHNLMWEEKAPYDLPSVRYVSRLSPARHSCQGASSRAGPGFPGWGRGAPILGECVLLTPPRPCGGHHSAATSTRREAAWAGRGVQISLWLLAVLHRGLRVPLRLATCEIQSRIRGGLFAQVPVRVLGLCTRALGSQRFPGSWGGTCSLRVLPGVLLNVWVPRRWAPVDPRLPDRHAEERSEFSSPFPGSEACTVRIVVAPP